MRFEWLASHEVIEPLNTKVKQSLASSDDEKHGGKGRKHSFGS